MSNPIPPSNLYWLLGTNITAAAVLLFLLLHHLKLVQNDFPPTTKQTDKTEIQDTTNLKPAPVVTPQDSTKKDSLKKNTSIADTVGKEKKPAGQNNAGNVTKNDDKGVSFYNVLILMLLSGGLGGILCNLRGFFMHYRSEEQSFPAHLEIPYYVRPFMGAGAGIFIYFVANFLVTSLTVEYKTNVPFQGMISFIALAMLAGFGSMEFFQRLKETALTFFGQKAEKDRWQKIDDLYALHKKGILTEAEYQTEKTKLLNQYSDAESRGELFIPKPK